MEKTKNELRIIAVDFDGTLVEDMYPKIGKPIYKTWMRLFKEQAQGSKIILWTCRNGKALEDAVTFCREEMGFHFDAINENIDEIKVLYGGDTRKVFATEYWDDKAADYFKESLEDNLKQEYERFRGYV